MKNKVLVKLIVPELDRTFDVFIPVNEVMWKIKKLIVKSVYDLSGGAINIDNEFEIINLNTSECYSNNKILYDTDIRNATELVLLLRK